MCIVMYVVYIFMAPFVFWRVMLCCRFSAFQCLKDLFTLEAEGTVFLQNDRKPQPNCNSVASQKTWILNHTCLL